MQLPFLALWSWLCRSNADQNAVNNRDGNNNACPYVGVLYLGDGVWA